jgi:hypothetical protein
MWIVGHDMDYYPKIYKFDKEEDAMEKYNDIKEDINIGEYPDNESCVFIAKVNKYMKGNDYKLIDDKTYNKIRE